MTQRRLAVVLMAVAALLGLAGIATASWRAIVSTSKTTGTANAEAARQITIQAIGGSASALYPGGPGGDVTLRITDPYAQTISITGLAGSVTTGNPGCTGDDFLIAASPTGLPSTLSGTVTVTLTAAVTMKSTASNSCQGATATVAYSITGKLG